MDPKTLEDYNQKFHANTKVTGYGVDGVRMVVPCPFCAEPGFIDSVVIEMEQAMENGSKCKHCGRSAKAIFDRSKPDSTLFEIVQTGGDDAPAYLPSIRRVAIDEITGRFTT